jgi:hypothetical protein
MSIFFFELYHENHLTNKFKKIYTYKKIYEVKLSAIVKYI